jgi:hypothetical protein
VLLALAGICRADDDGISSQYVNRADYVGAESQVGRSGSGGFGGGNKESISSS